MRLSIRVDGATQDELRALAAASSRVNVGDIMAGCDGPELFRGSTLMTSEDLALLHEFAARLDEKRTGPEELSPSGRIKAEARRIAEAKGIAIDVIELIRGDADAFPEGAVEALETLIAEV